VRIDYSVTGYPDDFKLFLNNEEGRRGERPVITGWAYAGNDGWQIVRVVEKKDAYRRWAMARTR
jgi:hypothetical protein